jgi:hypothetical protein
MKSAALKANWKKFPTFLGIWTKDGIPPPSYLLFGAACLKGYKLELQ